MNNISLDDTKIIILIIFFLLLNTIILLFCIKKYFWKKMDLKLDKMYSNIKKDIINSITPNFIKISLETEDIIRFAIEAWHLQQRIENLKTNLDGEQKKVLQSSVNKLLRFFEKYDIEIIDYTKKEKYNDGLNLDILSVEKDVNIKESIIKETIEPMILYRGRTVHKAKIILLTKEN